MKETNVVKGNIFEQNSQVSQSAEVKTPVNYKATWGRESGKQPGMMLEVLNMGEIPFKKINAA